MKRAFYILLLLISIMPAYLTSITTEAEKRPSWIDAPESTYPVFKYLSAVGSASSKEVAEKNSIANLAKMFNSDISFSETSMERYRKLISYAGSSASQESQTLTPPQKIELNYLKNIEIGQSWKDEQGQFYVIAFIDRYKASADYVRVLRENKNHIQHYMEQSMISSNSWKVYACYSAMDLIKQYADVLLSQLKIISPDTEESSSIGYDATEFKSKLSMWAKHINYTVEVFGETGYEDRVKQAISDAITTSGWSITEINAALVEGHIYLNQSGKSEVYEAVDSAYSISVYGINGNLMFNISNDFKEESPNIKEAQEKVIETMISKIRLELPQRIIKSFDDIAVE